MCRQNGVERKARRSRSAFDGGLDGQPGGSQTLRHDRLRHCSQRCLPVDRIEACDAALDGRDMIGKREAGLRPGCELVRRARRRVDATDEIERLGNMGFAHFAGHELAALGERIQRGVGAGVACQWARYGRDSSLAGIAQEGPFGGQPVAGVAGIVVIALEHRFAAIGEIDAERRDCCDRRQAARARPVLRGRRPGRAIRRSAGPRFRLSTWPRSCRGSEQQPLRFGPVGAALELAGMGDMLLLGIEQDRAHTRGKPGSVRISGRSSMNTSQPRLAARATFSSLVSSKIHVRLRRSCPRRRASARQESRARPRADHVSGRGYGCRVLWLTRKSVVAGRAGGRDELERHQDRARRGPCARRRRSPAIP